MGVPSRVFVGITVFGLIASLVTVPYTLLVLSGYTPPADSPVPTFENVRDPAQIVFFVLASLFSVGLTVFAWRSLIRGARHDAQKRKTRAKAAREIKEFARQRRGPGGPT